MKLTAAIDLVVADYRAEYEDPNLSAADAIQRARADLNHNDITLLGEVDLNAAYAAVLDASDAEITQALS
jgi:hypothetical protein